MIDIDIFEAVREVERLLKAKHTGTDLYLQALANVTGMPLVAIPAELRAPLKLASFGARYGVSAETIQRLTAPYRLALCRWCLASVVCDPGQVVLSCWPVLTPYTKSGQTTRVERHAHGLGKILNRSE